MGVSSLRRHWRLVRILVEGRRRQTSQAFTTTERNDNREAPTESGKRSCRGITVGNCRCACFDELRNYYLPLNLLVRAGEENARHWDKGEEGEEKQKDTSIQNLAGHSENRHEMSTLSYRTHLPTNQPTYFIVQSHQLQNECTKCNSRPVCHFLSL